MLKTSTIRSVLLVTLLIFFMIGVGHLFVLRFQTGDVYPAYSSLRSDPLGTRVFYDSLENIENLALSRNHYLLDSLEFETGTTFFYLGVPADDNTMVPEDLMKVFDRLTQTGGRLVLSFLPFHKEYEKNVKPENESCPLKPEDAASEKQSEINTLGSIEEHWGIDFEFNPNIPVEDGKYPVLNAFANRRDLPAVISWHTNFFFNPLDSNWQVLYSSAGYPVMVERPFGKGSIVLCADSFFISNEAMRSERHPQLLVWLIGGNNKIIFDETHFGIYKQPSVASLLRHYRFHGAFLVLGVMAFLFVWKNTAYFIPPRKDDLPRGTQVASEKDYPQGLIAMLRRNIASADVLQVCGREWERTFKKDKRIRPGVFKKVKAILQTLPQSAGKRKDVVQEYRKISEVISKDKKI